MTALYVRTNGTTVEIGTIEHNGKEFTNLGSIIDFAGGHVACYVKAGTESLTTWDGREIGRWSTVRRWRQNGYRMHAISAKLYGDPRTWHGRYGSDWSELVRLRPVKNA